MNFHAFLCFYFLDSNGGAKQYYPDILREEFENYSYENYQNFANYYEKAEQYFYRCEPPQNHMYMQTYTKLTDFDQAYVINVDSMNTSRTDCCHKVSYFF